MKKIVKCSLRAIDTGNGNSGDAGKLFAITSTIVDAAAVESADPFSRRLLRPSHSTESTHRTWRQWIIYTRVTHISSCPFPLPRRIQSHLYSCESGPDGCTIALNVPRWQQSTRTPNTVPRSCCFTARLWCEWALTIYSHVSSRAWCFSIAIGDCGAVTCAVQPTIDDVIKIGAHSIRDVIVSFHSDDTHSVTSSW